MNLLELFRFYIRLHHILQSINTYKVNWCIILPLQLATLQMQTNSFRSAACVKYFRFLAKKGKGSLNDSQLLTIRAFILQKKAIH